MATTKDLTEINLGHADVTWGGTTLGHTMGGVTINIETTIVDAMTDDYGQSPVFGVYNGDTIEVTVPITQLASDTLETAFPFATLEAGKLELGKVVGEKTTAHSAELVVQPKNSAFEGVSLVVHEAVVVSRGEINFNNDEQTVIELTFRGYVDAASTTGLLGYFGSPA